VSAFLETALKHIARGWYVHPLKPADKRPITEHGKNDATLDEAQVRAWWLKWPTANVGISCGPSGICVLDADHGLSDYESFVAWRDRNGLPVTYSVRSGRRVGKDGKPEFGAQMYYAGSLKDGKFELDGVTGEIKSLGGLVMSVGNVHPDTKEVYQLIVDAPLAPVPAIIDQARTRAEQTRAERRVGELITENRNNELCSEVAKFRNRNPGVSEDATVAYTQQWNIETCAEPMSCDEVEETTRKQFRLYPDAEVLPEITLGEPEEKKITDWRERYLTFERVRDAKPVEFLIEGFFALDSITALAAPVGQRKSLIAMNVAHALCTGEPLFDYFKVVKRPSRVVYLCPEMGLSSFSKRLKGIGLDSYVGQSLFCQTMDEDSIKLTDLDEELPGAVLIIDTLTRFVEGNQNEAEDMSRFAKVIFTLKRRGATVLLLHHSNKGPANAPITLDSAMRGSTELAAFVTCCWATRLQNPDEPYQSPSLLVNVKQRDFESKPFEASCDETCRMRMIGEPGQLAERQTRSDVDAKLALTAILKADPKMGINKLRAALRDAGHGKGQKWVTRARAAILGTGVSLTSS
jgi:Bifunctional DNA primase/polymerase, N-terminal/AAA domain